MAMSMSMVKPENLEDDCCSSYYAVEERRLSKVKVVYGEIWKRSTRNWNYLEDYRPGAGGVLTVKNAIGTQLRELINPGLARWWLSVKLYGLWRCYEKRKESRE